MFTLTKEFSFEASHQLPRHGGKCARLHGHSWKGRVIVGGDSLQECGVETGMLVDYYILKVVLEPIVEEYLDHYHLNDSLELEHPTSEMVAHKVYGMVLARLSKVAGLGKLRLIAVEIDETCTCSARYAPGISVGKWEQELVKRMNMLLKEASEPLIPSSIEEAMKLKQEGKKS